MIRTQRGLQKKIGLLSFILAEFNILSADNNKDALHKFYMSLSYKIPKLDIDEQILLLAVIVIIDIHFAEYDVFTNWCCNNDNMLIDIKSFTKTDIYAIDYFREDTIKKYTSNTKEK